MENFLETNHNINDIVLACWVSPGSGEAIHRNRSSHGLAFHREGEKIYTFSNGQKYIVKSNDFIYLPKNSTYTVKTIVPGDTYCINFQLSKEDYFPSFTFHLKKTDDIIHAYQNAEKAWRRKKEGYMFLCKSELYKILYIIKNNSTIPYAPNSKQALLQPAISYIHKHYTEGDISVEKLSKLCGFSYEYFRRLFHQSYGCSPVKYINGLKLKRAKELLESGLYSISETAFQSGFFELSYFSRFFKKNVGLSPNEYINRK